MTTDKPAENVWAEDSSQLNAVIQALDGGVSVQSPDLNILYANDWLKDIYGKDIIGRYCYEVYAWNSAACRGCPVLRAFRSGAVERAVKRSKRPDGTEFFATVSASPVVAENGKSIACVELIQDVSERLQAKIDLRKANRSLSRSVDQLTTLNSLMSALAASRSPEELFPKIIKDACRLLRADAADISLLDGGDELRMAASHNLEKEIVDAVHLSVGESLTGRVVSRGSPIVVNDVVGDPRFRFRDLAKKYEYYGFLGVPMKIGDEVVGAISFYAKRKGKVFTGEDISVAKAFADHASLALENARLLDKLTRETEELERANEELRELDAAKDEFVAIASHELRTPITVVKGYLSVLSSNILGELTGAQMEKIEKATRRLDELARLVEDYLDLASIRGRRLRVHKEEFMLRDAIVEATEAAEARYPDKRVEFECTVDGSLAAYGDRLMVTRIFRNLIENAWKFVDEKGSIEVTARERDGEIMACVADDGGGIPPERLERVFDRFYVGEPVLTRRSVGSGLGLSIAKELVEAHGGRIWIDSGKGKGTKVFFTIPGRARPG